MKFGMKMQTPDFETKLCGAKAKSFINFSIFATILHLSSVRYHIFIRRSPQYISDK